MKTFTQATVLISTAFAIVLAASASADAQRVRKNETWCLETSLAGGDGGGGTMNICNFETRAQCIASKVAQGDHCELNPVLAFEQWNRTHRR